MIAAQTAQAPLWRGRLFIGIASLLALMSSVVLAAGPANADSSGDLNVPSLSAEENAMLNSGVPVTVTIDPATGEFTGVEETHAGFQTFGVSTNNCSSGRACWSGYYAPDAYYGFNGSGASGTWPSRGHFYSGSYSAKPCWLSSGATVCSQSYLPKQTTATFQGARLTGKKVTLK